MTRDVLGGSFFAGPFPLVFLLGSLWNHKTGTLKKTRRSCSFLGVSLDTVGGNRKHLTTLRWSRDLQNRQAKQLVFPFRAPIRAFPR